MTKSDPSMLDDTSDPARFGLKQIILATLAGLVLTFAVGVAAGLTVSLLENGVNHPLRAVLVFGVVLALVGSCIAVIRRQIAPLRQEPVAPRIRKARWIMAMMLVAGIVVSLILPLDSIIAPGASTQGPDLTPAVSVFLIAVIVVAGSLATVLWWRNIDELERDAYREGAFWAANFFALVLPCWWLAWRGNLSGEPNYMVVWLAAMGVWTAVWLWRRYA